VLEQVPGQSSAVAARALDADLIDDWDPYM
jgi:hypothetical protein